MKAMQYHKYSLSILLSVFASGCIHRSWVADWSRLPHGWRTANVIDASKGEQPIVVGIRGSRFAERSTIWFEEFEVGEIEAARLSSAPVSCTADGSGCIGIAADAGSGKLQVLVRMDSAMSRFSAAAKIHIAVMDREFDLPILTHAYDLDNSVAVQNPISTRLLRCAAAEGRVLASRELPRIQHDLSKGLVSKDEALAMEKQLAPFITNNYPVCR